MDRKQRFYVWLTAFFVAALITGDLIGGKFFMLFGRNFSSGIIPFPLTFLLTDLVNEFYGTHGARRLTFVGLGAALFVCAVITIGINIPTSPDSPIPDAIFRAAFGTSARLYVASLSAYMIGQMLDITVFGLLRRVTGHRFLWLRATGSTVLSQMIDSFIVNFGLLVGMKPMGFIVGTAANNYVGKLVIAVLLTPFIYLGHAIFRRYFLIPERDTPATPDAPPGAPAPQA